MSSLQQIRGQLRLLQRSASRYNSTTASTVKTPVETPVEIPVDEISTIETSKIVESSSAKLLNAYNKPYDGSLDQLSEMTESEFNEILSKSPNPTSNRDEVINSKFQNLLNLYGNRDKLKKSFSSSSSLLSKFPNLIPSDKYSPYTKSELTIRQRHHSQIMGNLGSKIVNVYKPHELISNPSNINQITVEKLLASGAHLGRSTKLFNSNFQPFVYGRYKDLHIIDLDKTISYLKNACKVIEKVVENGGLVLFLGLKIGQLRAIKKAADNCNGYYVARKWIPGAITNSLENPKPRFEVDMQDLKTNRELSTDESNKVLKPDLIVILNPENASVAIKEANQARIPTIGIIDSNVDPNLVTYPIPANSSSNRTTNLICGVLGKSGKSGLDRRLQKVIEYKKNLGLEDGEAFTEIERIITEK